MRIHRKEREENDRNRDRIEKEYEKEMESMERKLSNRTERA